VSRHWPPCHMAVNNRILTGYAAVYLMCMSTCSDAVQHLMGAVLRRSPAPDSQPASHHPSPSLAVAARRLGPTTVLRVRPCIQQLTATTLASHLALQSTQLTAVKVCFGSTLGSNGTIPERPSTTRSTSRVHYFSSPPLSPIAPS